MTSGSRQNPGDSPGFCFYGAEFTHMIDYKHVFVLGTLDYYQYMNPELVYEIDGKVSEILEREV